MEYANAYYNCAFVSLDDKAFESLQALQCVIKEQLCLPARVIVYMKVIDRHRCCGKIQAAENLSKMKPSVLIVVGFISFSIQQDTSIEGNQGNCVESCKDGEQERLGDHCYYWSTARKTWDNSESHCNAVAGHLAAVTSLEIHNFLLQKVEAKNSHTWYWIGGSDKTTEGNWEWVDGSVWNFTIWADQPFKQQPAGGVNYDCLQIYHYHHAQNGWNDHFCHYASLFICSWEICPGSNK